MENEPVCAQEFMGRWVGSDLEQVICRRAWLVGWLGGGVRGGYHQLAQLSCYIEIKYTRGGSCTFSRGLIDYQKWK